MTTGFLLKTEEWKKQNPAMEDIARTAKGLIPGDFGTDYFILEKQGAQFEGVSISYMQMCLCNSPYDQGMALVEYRDGVAGTHFRGYIEFGDPLLSLFQGYLNQDDAWQTMIVWRNVSNEFDDLPRANSAADFFTNDEWTKFLQSKKREKELMKKIYG